jgi:hypothetical protein
MNTVITTPKAERLTTLRAALQPGAPLHALTGVPAFILCALGGGKEPLHYGTNPPQPHDAQDRAIWLDASTQTIMVECLAGDHGVGYVLHVGSQRACVDLDHCIAADGSLTAGARRVLDMFPGCAVEVSQSGTGLHLWLSYTGTMPEHRTRTMIDGQKIEIYTRDRYIALTGRMWSGRPSGSAAVDLTAQLTAFLADMPASAAESVEWCDSGVILTQEMVNAVPPNVWILGGTSESDMALFHALIDHVRRARPRADNRTDHGLLERLARLAPNARTTANAARTQHLDKSGKWDRDRDLTSDSAYVRRSILAADGKRIADLKSIGFGGATLPARAPQLPAASVPLPTAEHLQSLNEAAKTDDGNAVVGWLTPDAQIGHFAGCTWVQSVDRVFYKGDLLDQSRFNAVKGGFAFEVSPNKSTKSAWETFRESHQIRFPQVKRLVFRPELEPGAVIVDEGEKVLNSYWPVTTLCEAGDVTPFTDHLAKLLPLESDRAILIAYLAALVQHPGVKFQWCPVIQGAPGNGKTLILSALERCIGSRYSHRPNARDLDNKFTGWLDRKLLIGIEELRIGSRLEMLEVLKPLVTNDRIELQGKGQDQVTGDNRANFVMFSNFKDAVIKRDDDRRYAIFFTVQQSPADLTAAGMGGDYFPALYAWLNGTDPRTRAATGRTPGYAHVHHWLKHYAIPADLNPAGRCHRAPYTSSTAEALEVSKGPIEQAIIEAVDSGIPGFCGGFVSSIAVAKLCEELRTKMTPHQRKEMLKAMGYVPHPGLAPRGQVHNPVLPDNGRPYLYVKPGSDAAKMEWNERAVDIARRYSVAQIPAPGTFNTFNVPSS